MDGFENNIIARAQGDFVTGPDDGFRTEEEIAADLAKPGHPSTDAGHEAQSSVPPSEQKVPSYHDDEPAGHDPHAYVGISLIAGFILMYLIDTLPRRASSSSQPQRFQINLTQFSLNRASTSSPDLESPQQDGDYHATSNSGSSSRPLIDNSRPSNPRLRRRNRTRRFVHIWLFKQRPQPIPHHLPSAHDPQSARSFRPHHHTPQTRSLQTRGPRTPRRLLARCSSWRPPDLGSCQPTRLRWARKHEC